MVFSLRTYVVPACNFLRYPITILAFELSYFVATELWFYHKGGWKRKTINSQGFSFLPHLTVLIIMGSRSPSPTSMIVSPLLEGRFADFGIEARTVLYTVLHNRLRSFKYEEDIQACLDLDPILAFEYIRDNLEFLVRSNCVR